MKNEGSAENKYKSKNDVLNLDLEGLDKSTKIKSMNQKQKKSKHYKLINIVTKLRK